MNRNSNTYTLIYSIIMVVIVATLLTVVSVVFSPRQQKNIELEKKNNILKSINIKAKNNEIEDLFTKYIVESYAVNRKGEILSNVNISAFDLSLKEELNKPVSEQFLPVYVARLDDGSQKYIFTLIGKGLWGAIWGYISLDDDMNTVYGVNFDHVSETPGLGAEISTAEFQSHFFGKQIFDQNDSFVSINVTKRADKTNKHDVDAISGGTITSTGLKDMLYDCLSAYIEFINGNKKY